MNDSALRCDTDWRLNGGRQFSGRRRGCKLTLNSSPTSSSVDGKLEGSSLLHLCVPLIKTFLSRGCTARQTDRQIDKSALRGFVAKQQVNSFAIAIRRIIMEKKRLLTTQLHICTI